MDGRHNMTFACLGCSLGGIGWMFRASGELGRAEHHVLSMCLLGAGIGVLVGNLVLLVLMLRGRVRCWRACFAGCLLMVVANAAAAGWLLWHDLVPFTSLDRLQYYFILMLWPVILVGIVLGRRRLDAQLVEGGVDISHVR
jgi:hypothetical protein